MNAQVIQPLRRELPLGYSMNVSGQAKDLDRTWDSLKWSFFLAILITYLLMCSLYESFTYPSLFSSASHRPWWVCWASDCSMPLSPP